MADNIRQDILDDGGVKSRKFWLTLLGVGILSWGYWLAPYSALLPGLYPTFGGFILAALGLYFGVNATHSFIASKTYVPTQSSVQEPVQPPVPPNNIVPPQGP